MKKKNVKQRLNAMIKELADANYTHIGLVLLEDLIQRTTKENQQEIKNNIENYSRSFVSPQVYLDVYEIILKNLNTGDENN
jgi:hypothetical protein